MSSRIPQSIFALFTLLLLSACGFTLRGSESVSLPPQLQELNLQYDSSNALGQILTRQLLANGVTLGESNIPLRLSLAEEQSRERVVSVNRNIRAGEYELTMSTSFQLSQNGEIIFSSGPISLFRIYEADPSNAAAKINEAELIQNEMRQELVAQVMNRLQALEI